MKLFWVWALASTAMVSCGEGENSKNDPSANGASASANAVDVADVPAGANAEIALKQGSNTTLRNLVPIDGLPTIGPVDALVTIVELTDYDCPYCAKAEVTMQSLRTKYGNDLRFAVAENPLPMHPHSDVVAKFALAANDRGVFKEAHESLFANRTAHSDADLQKLAEALGVSPSFATSTSSLRGLQTSAALANELHVHGTPMFFVNGRKISGAQPIDTFTAMIDEERAHALALVASGVARSRVYDRILAEAKIHPAPLDDPSEPAAFSPEAANVTGPVVMGDPNAKQTLVLFTDFQCPYCARLDTELRALVAQEKDVRVVMRNHPLPIHANAKLAAKAALAADAQGKLAPYAEALFQHQNALDRASLSAYATDVGLDVARFDRDIDSPATSARLAEDEALAQKLDVRGTPTSFVQGNRIIGAQPPLTFDRELTKARAR